MTMAYPGMMVLCIAFPLLHHGFLEFMRAPHIAAEATSLPSYAQAGHSLIQTKRLMASAAPAVEDANNGTMGPEGKYRSTRLAKLNSLSRLASKPQLLKDGFCRSHPCSTLQQKDTDRGLGVTATTNEPGYEAVAKLKSDEEMKTFMLRVIEDYDCHVEDEGGLMGIVPWFSGTTAVQSLAQLVRALLFAVLANGERWLSYKNSAGMTGADVPLDLQGYMQVAIIRKDIEMEIFSRRLANQMGIKVTDEGGFKGMVMYHSGAAAFQSFGKLRDEIKAAVASPHGWAKLKSL